VLTQFWNENLVYAVCLVQIMFQDQKATNVFLPGNSENNNSDEKIPMS
jgi:hypothetical protein